MMSAYPLIMVGGKSGVGKTSIIDFLINNWETLYERPISYTSRKKRTEEKSKEYVFSDLDTMIEKKQQGDFVNFDYAYGNYYAMEKASLESIILRNKIPIKEIHPRNHNNLLSIYPNSISVLIKSNDSVDLRDDRLLIDDDYYKNLDESIFDVIFYNDKSLSVKENAYYFNLRLKNFLKYRSRFPKICEMDSMNYKGYSLIAEEFTEEKRITTHNFHTLSQQFFISVDNRYVNDETLVLEIGPGQGWLKKSCLNNTTRYDVLELTEKMASYNNSADNVIISSAARTHIDSDKYDVVFSSLGDPYLHIETLCEVYRILSIGGYFAFSIPAKQWAEYLRGRNKETTTFVSEDGEEATTFSFVFDEKVLKELLTDCGFKVEQLLSINGKELKNNREVISPAIIAAAQNYNTQIEKLDIVTVCLCKKELNYE